MNTKVSGREKKFTMNHKNTTQYTDNYKNFHQFQLFNSIIVVNNIYFIMLIALIIWKLTEYGWNYKKEEFIYQEKTMQLMN